MTIEPSHIKLSAAAPLINAFFEEGSKLKRKALIAWMKKHGVQRTDEGKEVYSYWQFMAALENEKSKLPVRNE